MFHDFVVLDPVQVDIGAELALVRPLGGNEDKVSLSQQKPDLIDRPIAREDPQVAHELVATVGDAWLMADTIVTRGVLRDYVMPAVDTASAFSILLKGQASAYAKWPASSKDSRGLRENNEFGLP